MKKLKQRLQKGETVLGTWLNLGSSLTAEIVGLAGFDWVLIDLEHGAGGEKDVLFQLQALEHTPAAPIIRVESYERQRFHRVLDMGAEGIMCPRIKTPEEARRAVAALRYQPEGDRGVAMMIRASNFGVNFKDYKENQTRELLGVIQIETSESLKCLDEIAAIDGVDVLFVGPMDLTCALGVFGQFDHPAYLDAFTLVVEAARRHQKAVGVLMRSPEEFDKYYKLGVRFFACGADAAFVNNGARAMIQALSNARSAAK